MYKRLLLIFTIFFVLVVPTLGWCDGTSFSDSILDSFSGGFFSALGSACVTAFNWLLNGIILVIGYTLLNIFDGLIQCASGLFATIGLGAMLTSSFAQMLTLPDGMLWILNQLGFFTGIALILPAMVIRKIIDMIPGGWQV